MDRWQVELLLCCRLWCGDADGLGSCHELELTLVARQQVVRVLPLVGHCLRVLLLGGSSSKGSPGGGGGRISPKRCVSSMLICHPLNLYCSSTGSISHIARTLVLLRLGSPSSPQREKGHGKREIAVTVMTPKALWYEGCNFRPVPILLHLPESPLSTRASVSQHSSLVSAFKGMIT